MSNNTCAEFEQYVHRVYDERLQQLDNEIELACANAKKDIISQAEKEVELFTRNAHGRFKNERAEQVAQAKLHSDTVIAQTLDKMRKETYAVFLDKLSSSKQRTTLFEKLLTEIKSIVKKDGVLLKDCELYAWKNAGLKQVSCTLEDPVVKAETQTTVYEYSLIDWFTKEFKKEARK